jgi:hypothetical protein
MRSQHAHAPPFPANLRFDGRHRPTPPHPSNESQRRPRHRNTIPTPRRGTPSTPRLLIMPDHIHALITPAIDHATSRCVQLIKGGSSFLIGKPATGKIWQDGYHEHRIRDATDYTHQLQYIADNPNRKNYSGFSHVHTTPEYHHLLDRIPDHLFLAS